MSRRILLADDSVTIQKVIELTFMDEDYDVKAVSNGEVRYIRVTAAALKKGLVVKAPKRTWKKGEPAPAACDIKFACCRAP